MILTLSAIFCLLALAGSAQAAVKPKSWQWTPAQAARELVASNPAVNVDPEWKRPLDLRSTTCRGQGKAVQHRYTAFRCVGTFAGISARDPLTRRVVWAKVRKVGKGDLCVSVESLAAVPGACLATKGAPRVRGTISAAAMALREWLPTQFGGPSLAQGMFYGTGYGAGYYLFTFESTRSGSASVTLTTRGPVVKLIAWTS